MFLRYKTRQGNYNLMSPTEVSYSCHVTVYDDEANLIKSCSFTPEYELEGSDVDEIQAEIKESLDRYWSTDKSRKEMLDFLDENSTKIERGNKQRRLAEIKTEIAALEEEAERLENSNA